MCHAPRTLLSFPTRRSSDLDRDEHHDEDDDVDERDEHQDEPPQRLSGDFEKHDEVVDGDDRRPTRLPGFGEDLPQDRKSTRLNSSHVRISYAVFCLKKKIVT